MDREFLPEPIHLSNFCPICGSDCECAGAVEEVEAVKIEVVIDEEVPNGQ
jgi:hypothetical protein